MIFLKNFADSKFNMWILYVNYCKNTTENNFHCKSREEIQEIMKETYFYLTFTNFYIDSSDYQLPIKKTYTRVSIRSSASNNRRDTFHLRKFYYYSDNGLLLEDWKKHEGFFIQKHEYDILEDKNSELMLKIGFTLDKFQQKIQRSYIKIQKVAADIGGIIKFFSLIFSFLATNYSKIKLYDYFISYFKLKASSNNKNLNTIQDIKKADNICANQEKIISTSSKSNFGMMNTRNITNLKLLNNNYISTNSMKKENEIKKETNSKNNKENINRQEGSSSNVKLSKFNKEGLDSDIEIDLSIYSYNPCYFFTQFFKCL